MRENPIIKQLLSILKTAPSKEQAVTQQFPILLLR
jgi:hypothetical protein